MTVLIQPKDQDVMLSLKRRYKKKLLRRLIIENDEGKSMVEFLKGVNMRVVIELVHKSWEEITGETLRNSWRKILPMKPIHPAMSCFTELYDEEKEVNSTNEDKLPAVSIGCGISRGLRIRLRQEPEVNTDEEEQAGVDTNKEERAEVDTDEEEQAGVDTDEEERAGVDTDEEEQAGVDTDEEERAGVDTDEEERAGVDTDEEERAGVDTDEEERAGVDTDEEERAGVDTDEEERAGVDTDEEERAGMT